MNRLIPLAAVLAAAAIATTGCNRPSTQSTANNNSGADATRAQPASTTDTTVSTTTTTPAGSSGATGATSTLTTGDTTTANTSSTGSALDNRGTGNAAGAVNETVTTGKIKAAIAGDSAMKDSDISVTTNSGVVTLSGTVKSQDQVAIATNLAQRQEGVTRVESNINVR